MSLSQRQSQKREKKVKEGINFVLNHFPKDNVFPREISTQQSSSYVQSGTIVYNKKEMFSVYEQSDFIDCKVSAYPAFTSEKFIHYNRVNIQTPDFIFINTMSKQSGSGSSSSSTTSSCKSGSEIVDQVNILFPILQNIKELLYEAKPTILWDGNGFQIYQPVQTITLEDLENEYIDLERLEEFRCFITQQQLLSSLFLDFSTQRLLYKDSYDDNTNRHYTSNIISYKFPYMLPIPGTLNSIYISIDDDEKSEIQIAQKWDSNRPKIDILLSAFQAHLTYRKNIKKEKDKDKRRTQYGIII
jgi:hypothetical protein